jgi:biopolymer transport protein ExbD
VDFRHSGFRQRRSDVVLDLTPLIDCIFQLLLFFLLTASFGKDPSFGVEVPKASSKATDSAEGDIMVAVTREGDIMYKGEKLSAEELSLALKKLHAERPNTRVQVRADTKAYHGSVIKVMDAVRAAGFKRLGVAVRRQ